MRNVDYFSLFTQIDRHQTPELFPSQCSFSPLISLIVFTTNSCFRQIRKWHWFCNVNWKQSMSLNKNELSVSDWRFAKVESKRLNECIRGLFQFGYFGRQEFNIGVTVLGKWSFVSDFDENLRFRKPRFSLKPTVVDRIRRFHGSKNTSHLPLSSSKVFKRKTTILCKANSKRSLQVWSFTSLMTSLSFTDNCFLMRADKIAGDDVSCFCAVIFNLVNKENWDISDGKWHQFKK